MMVELYYITAIQRYNYKLIGVEYNSFDFIDKLLITDVASMETNWTEEEINLFSE